MGEELVESSEGNAGIVLTSSFPLTRPTANIEVGLVEADCLQRGLHYRPGSSTLSFAKFKIQFSCKGPLSRPGRTNDNKAREKRSIKMTTRVAGFLPLRD